MIENILLTFVDDNQNNVIMYIVYLLGPNSNSKNLRWYRSISNINPKGHPPLLSTHQVQEVLDVRECIRKNSSLTSTINKVKLKYISEGQPPLLKLIFGVELDLNSRF